MSAQTGIEWCDSTWNPVTGCTEVSPGCDHCYAKTFAERWRGTPGHYFERGFDVQLRPDKLDQPLRWRKPRRIFVNSMSDLFHDAVPDEYIAKVFAVMATAGRHTYQVLTKRHARMRSLLNASEFRAEVQRHYDSYLCAPQRRPGGMFRPSHRWPLPNVWLGVSAENQQWADIRIPALLDTPAAVRFISAEPLLGPIDLASHLPIDYEHHHHDGSTTYGRSDGLDWVIVGGESGRGARPMHPDWARSLRDQCQDTCVAFLFKQAGSALAREWGCKGKGTDPAEWPETFPREYPNVS